MVKHNNRLVKNHFRKDWERHIKTWFDQPAKKAKRRLKRQKKAARLFPRPTENLLPLIRCPSIRYNTKMRLGRGFTLDELKLAKLPVKEARSIGIAVDFRRRNKSLETQRFNVQRLLLYKSKVVVFPTRRRVKSKKGKKGEAKEEKPAEKKPEEIKYRKSKLKLFTVGTPEQEEKASQLKTQFPYKFPSLREAPRAITEKERTDSAWKTYRSARRDLRREGIKKRLDRKAALGVPGSVKAVTKEKDIEDDDEEGKKGKKKKK